MNDVLQAARDLEDAVRFWRKVGIHGADECWEWKAGKFASGYGAFHRSNPRRLMKAHRAAIEFSSGRALGALHANHHCDNKGCCNPNHLYAGTIQENMEDRARRGRTHRLLSDDTIRSIRLVKGTQRAVAVQFQISSSQVWGIRNRVLYRDVP